MSENFIQFHNDFNSNIVNDYNKFLSDNLNNANQNINTNSFDDFDEVLNKQLKNFEVPKLDATVAYDENSINIKEASTQNSTSNDFMNNFGKTFGNSLNTLNETQLVSQRAIEKFATGGDIDVHEVMIASEKASVSMNLALQMRNKMLSFYNEIKNINV